MKLDSKMEEGGREGGSTQEGLMTGAGAAKTGCFLMRLGGEGEELRLATTEGRNAALLAED